MAASTAMLAAAAALLLLGAGGARAQTSQLPDQTLFAPVQMAGDLGTGFAAYYVGCADNGATLQDIIVYSNDNFLRGIEARPTALCLILVPKPRMHAYCVCMPCLHATLWQRADPGPCPELRLRSRPEKQAKRANFMWHARRST